MVAWASWRARSGRRPAIRPGSQSFGAIGEFGPKGFPARRRRRGGRTTLGFRARFLPVAGGLSDPIVAPASFRICEHRIGFVGLSDAVLGIVFAADIRVISPDQPAVGQPELFGACLHAYPEDPVIALLCHDNRRGQAVRGYSEHQRGSADRKRSGRWERYCGSCGYRTILATGFSGRLASVRTPC